ncbi:NADPH-dependent glutamate synthase [Aminobacterium colombiense]|uniref:Glutamate synthase (NADPH), homotetrameric n=1 Tax=Aminobacterium colombiense (strain DSM 12261 / ALA-1) TaxID=572547 RepID=D5EG04_AMICL|nr:NADPH-dependent glutamate synthase [Aminobacterium colombiense]ADE57486.1 glutamate synthase (NADPH), homotetrameric [Aminobacterium colombiense DSM 12261]
MALDIAPKRLPVPEQSAEERIKNFNDVVIGYSIEEAVAESARCLQCKNAPCIKGCPVSIDIPGFLKAIKEKDLEKSWDIISQYTNLPAVCGRVCPQEKQCEGVCTVGRIKGYEPVSIGKMERFIADWKAEHGSKVAPKVPEQTKGNVAVVGSGPSSLTVAGDLAKMGYKVTVYEALHAAGGVLMYGIPEFRLPKAIVRREIDNIKALGVKIETNVAVGRSVTIEELQSHFDAVYIATGAGTPHFMGVPGTSLNGVYSASEYLTRINLMHGYEFPKYDTPTKESEKVVVVGGGNVAMDAARSALRLGAKSVQVVYRRSLEELPARIEEYHHAVEEGVIFNWLTNPVEYVGSETGNIVGVKCIRMELGEPDASGRRRPQEIKGSEFTIEADTIIEAIGQGPNKVLLSAFQELKLNKKGYIDADPETGQADPEWVFAGGDIVTGAATVILAMGAGKKAAEAIDKYITEKKAAGK